MSLCQTLQGWTPWYQSRANAAKDRPAEGSAILPTPRETCLSYLVRHYMSNGRHLSKLFPESSTSSKLLWLIKAKKIHKKLQVHGKALGDCAGCRQTNLNSNKHKVICVGKSNLKWEGASVHSKLAAASEDGDLRMDEVGRAANTPPRIKPSTRQIRAHFARTPSAAQDEAHDRLHCADVLSEVWGDIMERPPDFGVPYEPGRQDHVPNVGSRRTCLCLVIDTINSKPWSVPHHLCCPAPRATLRQRADS